MSENQQKMQSLHVNSRMHLMILMNSFFENIDWSVWKSCGKLMKPSNVSCFQLNFFSVNTITHELMHLDWWNFAQTCTLATTRILLNIQGHRSKVKVTWVFVHFFVCTIPNDYPWAVLSLERGFCLFWLIILLFIFLVQQLNDVLVDFVYCFYVKFCCYLSIGLYVAAQNFFASELQKPVDLNYNFKVIFGVNHDLLLQKLSALCQCFWKFHETLKLLVSRFSVLHTFSVHLWLA